MCVVIVYACACVCDRRFVLRDEDVSGMANTWETRMAVKYYSRLYKEYCICDVTHYREGRIGLRWRTESEVVCGKGQFTCAAKGCDNTNALHSYELNFKYIEHGDTKNELVKVNVHPPMYVCVCLGTMCAASHICHCGML